jgi:hypothetical protein
MRKMKKGLKPDGLNPSVPNARRRSGSQFGFDLIHDAAEGGFIVDSQVSQNLAVDADGSFLQTVGKLAVGQTKLTGGRIDAGDPELTEDALFGATVTVGVLASLHHRLFGDAEDIAAATAETFGEG